MKNSEIKKKNQIPIEITTINTRVLISSSSFENLTKVQMFKFCRSVGSEKNSDLLVFVPAATGLRDKVVTES